MSKKMKIAYYAIIAISAVIFIVDLAIGRLNHAIIDAYFLVTTNIFFQLKKEVEEYKLLCDELLEETMALTKEYNDAMARERIHKQEFNKMRERAQNAEKKYQELVDDTPARDKTGRYIPRNPRKK